MGNPWVTGWVATLIAIVGCFAVHNHIDGVLLAGVLTALGALGGVSADRLIFNRPEVGPKGEMTDNG